MNVQAVFIPGQNHPRMNGICEQKHFHPGMKVILRTYEDTINVSIINDFYLFNYTLFYK